MEISKNSKATPSKRTAPKSSSNTSYNKSDAKQAYKAKSMRDDYYEDHEDLDDGYDSEDYY